MKLVLRRKLRPRAEDLLRAQEVVVTACPECVEAGTTPPRPACQPHTCPLKVELHGDSTTLCICCEHHQDVCADDV